MVMTPCSGSKKAVSCIISRMIYLSAENSHLTKPKIEALFRNPTVMVDILVNGILSELNNFRCKFLHVYAVTEISIQNVE